MGGDCEARRQAAAAAAGIHLGGGEPHDGDLQDVDARRRCDGLEELGLRHLELGGGERERDVDADGLGVGADVAEVAEAGELGGAASLRVGVERAGLGVGGRLAEGVGRAGRAVGEGGETVGGGVGAERAWGDEAAARAVEGRRAEEAGSGCWGGGVLAGGAGGAEVAAGVRLGGADRAVCAERGVEGRELARGAGRPGGAVEAGVEARRAGRAEASGEDVARVAGAGGGGGRRD